MVVAGVRDQARRSPKPLHDTEHAFNVIQLLEELFEHYTSRHGLVVVVPATPVRGPPVVLEDRYIGGLGMIDIYRHGMQVSVNHRILQVVRGAMARLHASALIYTGNGEWLMVVYSPHGESTYRLDKRVLAMYIREAIKAI